MVFVLILVLLLIRICFFSSSILFICFEFYFDFCLFLSKKNIVSVSWKAITWGHPLVIAPYNESVGLSSFDSRLPSSIPEFNR